MTVPVSTYKAGPYTGNGVATAFAFDFKTFAEGDIRVVLTVIATGAESDLVLDSDYSVTLNPDQEADPGGSITYPLVSSPMAITHKLTIVSDLDIAQPLDITNGGGFYPQVIEDELDRLTILIGQQQEALDRAIKVDVASSTGGVLPAVAQRANMYLAFDAEGEAIASPGPSDTPISSAMVPVVQGATLSAALTALGFSAFVKGLINLTTAALVRLGIGAAASGANTDITSLGSGTTATTQAVGDNSTKLATDAYVDRATANKFSGRLTLTTGTPVTVADVTAATTVYYAPYNGSTTPVYNGTNFVASTFSELSVALDSTGAHTGYHQSGKNFDVFLVNDAGTLRIGTGPAWSSDTARGTGAGTTELQLLSGIQTNKNAMTLRFGNASGNTVAVAANQGTYLGSFRATADGQTEDSFAKRFLWNCYNRVLRGLRAATETADSWNYSTATVRQANANVANQLDFLRGLDEDCVTARLSTAAICSGGNATTYVGIGLDSTTTIDTPRSQADSYHAVNTTGHGFNARWIGYPGLGRHYLTWLEYATAATTTWQGDGGVPTIYQAGVSGEAFA